MSDASDLAYKAAEVLETKGWCRYRLEDDMTGQHCLVGALYEATEQLKMNMFQLDVMWSKLADRLGVDVQHVGEWNDQPERNAEQIIKELRAFAESEE